jgi:hypothetical protein
MESAPSSAHQVTLAAFESELKTARTLLKIQQQETYHCQEHLSLLNAEIDTLRSVVDEQQQAIHALNLQLQEKTDKVKSFEDTFDQFRVDKHALYELETQNSHLLERMKEKQRQLDDREAENRYMLNHKDDATLAEEIRIKKVAELQIVMPIEFSQLEAKLERARSTIDEYEITISALKVENEQLRGQLQWNDEVKRDQLSRSMQSEYKMLMQLDQRDNIVKSLEVEKDTLQRVATVHQSRGDYIHRQFKESLKELDRTETVCGAVVDFVERDIAQLQGAQKLLRQENAVLQAESQLLHEIVSRSSTQRSFNKTFATAKRSSSSSSSLRLPAIFGNDTTGLLSPTSLNNFPTKFTHSDKLNSTAPSSLQSDTQPIVVNKQWDFGEFSNAIEIVDMQDMKRQCLAKVLSTALIMLPGAPELFNVTLPKNNIDLSNMSLVDEDIDQVHNYIILNSCMQSSDLFSDNKPQIISEFRKISFQPVILIQLNDNRLTSEGLFKLVAWILSLSNEEIRDRPSPLTIDLSNNKVNYIARTIINVDCVDMCSL